MMKERKLSGLGAPVAARGNFGNCGRAHFRASSVLKTLPLMFAHLKLAQNALGARTAAQCGVLSVLLGRKAILLGTEVRDANPSRKVQLQNTSLPITNTK